jgi:polar amino acid transport system substrate-binding protein
VRRRLVYHGPIIGSLVAALIAGSGPLEAAPLEQVMQNGALRLCAHPAALPYSDRSGQNGLHGFQIELAEAVAREMGLALTVTWGRAPNAERKGGCDAVMDSIALAVRYEREGRIGPLRPASGLAPRFSKSYAGSGVFLALPSGSPARRFEDLEGQKVGVVVGSVEHEWLAKKGLEVSVFAAPEEIVAALDTGAIGAGAVPAPVLGWYRREYPDARVTIPAGYEPEPALRWNVAIGLWRADDALVAAVNAAIDRVLEKQIPSRIYANYGVAYHPPFPLSGTDER